ncbi:MAG: TonB-dependent receptor [candidate division KSB1 bacterium]|nr:TonB-dependent receptor [candidate division KSB1 bacterium]
MTRRKVRRSTSGIATLGLVLWAFHASVAMAQEQKPLPGTRPALPSPDTTAAAKPPAEPSATERSRLELPDVLIIGQDRSRREAGEKLQAEAVPVGVYEPTVDYRPVRLVADEWGKKTTFSRVPQIRLRGLEARATYGDYRWLRGEAIHWAQGERLSYEVAGRIDRTDGPYRNSGWKKWAGQGRVGFDTKDGGHVSLRAGVAGQEIGMHTPVVKRVGSTSEVRGEYSGAARQLRLRVAAEAGWGSVEQRFVPGFGWPDSVVPRQDLLWNAKLSRSRLEAGCEWDAGPLGIQAGLRYNGYRFSPSLAESLAAKNDLSSLFVDLTVPIAQRASLASGVAIENWRQRGKGRTSRLSLNARAAGTVTPHLGVSCEVRSGFQPVDPLQIWMADPYFDARQTDWSAERVRASVGAAAELKLISGGRIRFRWRRAFLNGAHYWEEVADTCGGCSGTYLFAYRALEKLESNEVAIGLDLYSQRHLSATIELVQLSEELERSEDRLSYPGFTRRPFLAHWRLPIQSSWRPIPQLRVGLTAAWVGRRPRDLAGDRMLGAYTRADVDVEVAVSKNILVRGEARNLTDRRIVLRTGHPEFGRVFALGLHGAW